MPYHVRIRKHYHDVQCYLGIIGCHGMASIVIYNCVINSQCENSYIPNLYAYSAGSSPPQCFKHCTSYTKVLVARLVYNTID
jgi:hypothetical protein